MSEPSKYANVSFIGEEPKKTPMEILIEEVEQLKKTKLYTESFKALDDVIFLATANLEIEKKEMVNIANKAYACHDKNVYYKNGEAFIDAYFKNHLK